MADSDVELAGKSAETDNALSERLMYYRCSRSGYGYCLNRVGGGGGDGGGMRDRIGCRDRLNGPTRPPLKAVYVCGPSAVGKTNVLNIIRKRYPCARVASVNYENLYSLYAGDGVRAARYLARHRDDPLIYEHTNECTILYPIVHRYMEAAEPLTVAAVSACYRECADALVEPSGATMVLLLDTTFAYSMRYRRRLATAYNGIDYEDTRYLYFQLAAYAALLSKRHLYPFLRALITVDGEDRDDDDDDCIIIVGNSKEPTEEAALTPPRLPRPFGSGALFGGEPDYGLMAMLYGVLDGKKDVLSHDSIDFGETARFVVDRHIMRLDDSMELY